MSKIVLLSPEIKSIGWKKVWLHDYIWIMCLQMCIYITWYVDNQICWECKVYWKVVQEIWHTLIHKILLQDEELLSNEVRPIKAWVSLVFVNPLENNCLNVLAYPKNKETGLANS